MDTIDDSARVEVVVVCTDEIRLGHFCSMFQPGVAVEKALYPSILAARMGQDNRPKMVVFIHPYSSAMLRQVSEESVVCLVLDQYRPDVEYVKSNRLVRFFEGPETVSVYTNLENFVVKARQLWAGL